MAAYYKSVNCNPLTLLLRFVGGFVVQLVSTVDNILTDGASRGPSASAELIVMELA